MAEKVGTLKCLVCAEGIPAKSTSGGALSVNCPWCDFSGYAREGTQAKAILSKRVAPAEAAPAAPEAKGGVLESEPASRPKAKEKMPWEV